MDKKTKTNKVKILIIGGTGFIGYHLSLKCLKLGWSVTSFSLNKPKKKRKISKVNYLTGNLFLKNTLKKIDKQFDYVVNLGGYVDHQNAKRNYNTHFIGCKNLVKIFIKRDIKLFLQVGSGAEYGNLKSPHFEKFISTPKSTYGKTKFLATNFLIEQYKKKQFPCSVVRLYQVFGEKQDSNRIIPFIIRSCMSGLPFPCSNGKQYRDFIHIDQIINAFIKILVSKKILGEVLNIGSGRMIKVRTIINKIKFILKRGKPEFGKIKLRKDEMLKFYPNISKIYKLVKWKPENNFDKKLRNVINFEKNIS